MCALLITWQALTVFRAMFKVQGKNPKPSVLMNLCQAEKQKVNEGMDPGLTQGEILIH